MASNIKPANTSLADANSANNGICFSGLDPALGSLGELIGLLSSQDESTYCLEESWFESPIQNTANGVKGNGDKLASLLGQLLGEVGGQALGVPVKDPALVGTWYPINMPDTGKPTGLYIGSYPKDGEQVFGIGVYHKWPIPSDTPVLQIDVWAMIPLLRLGNGKLQPVLTTPGYPITLGIAAEGLDSKPLVDTNDFSFDGVKFSAAIDMASAIEGDSAQNPPVQLSIVILQLGLPGEAEAKDMSLADLATINAQEILNTASALFVTALSQVSQTAADHAKYLLPVLGLSTIMPGKTMALPILRWDQLFELALNKGDVTQPFRQWFRTVSSDPDLLKTWLSGVAGFMGQTADVTGDGTRANPFAVPIIDLSQTNPAVGVLSMTAATLVDTDAQRHLYPGLSFASTGIALGTSPAALRIMADIELAEFVLGVDGSEKYTGPSSLQFDVGLTLANKQAGQPLVDIDGYKFGYFKAGLELGADLNPVPSFNLVDIETPDQKFDSINLLSPGELASAAESTLVPMLEQQLFKLLGIEPGQKIPFASNAAALLGVTAPDVPGGTWPSDQLQPPFTIAQLPNTIKDPVAALGSYYQNILTTQTQVNGKAAFQYILLELAGLIQDAALGQATIQITGDGTQSSPWSATISLKDTSLPAALTAYTQAAGNLTQLVLGIELGPELLLGTTKVIPSVGVQFLTLDLPQPGSGAQFQGTWASDIHATLSLPEGFQSDPVGGATISLNRAAMSARWSRTDGWGWSLLAGQPTITIDGQEIALGQDLNFSDASSLRDLVTSGATAFAHLLTGVLGVALLRTEKRVGLALAGVLGLLKDINQAASFPPGLQWPSITPLSLDNLNDPRPALRAQLAKDFVDDETARAVLSLVAWAINGIEAQAPQINGTRSFAAPFKLPISSSGFQALVWYQDTGQTLGLGLGRTDVSNFTGLKITTESRLNCVEVSLASGQIQSGVNTPSLSLLATIENPEGMLFTGSTETGSLGKITLGCSLNLSGGQLQFNPVVTLVDVTLPGETASSTLTLDDFQSQDFADRSRQAFLFLVNQGVQLAVSQVSNSTSFKTLYSLLTSLGLAVKRETDSDPYGISPAGWQALLANPLGYVEGRFSDLLSDQELRSQLYAYIQSLLNIQLPEVPKPALDLLSALGIVGDEEHGYPLQPDALLALAQHPFATLSAAFQQLVENPAALKALAGKLAGNIKPPDFGPFTFQSTAGTKISLGIKPENAVVIAGLVNLSGEITLDLGTPSIGVQLRAFNPVLQLAAVPALSYRLDTPSALPAFTFDIAWGDGSRPAPEALRLFPFDQTQFLNQLADLAPDYVLSMLVTTVLESNVLKKYPLAQQVFQALGIAQLDDGRWTMPSLIGLLRDPKGWLLSEGILGKEGKFDLTSFGAILKKLPAVSASNGLAVAPTASGAKVSGLPFNFEIDFAVVSDPAAQATITVATQNLPVAGGKGNLENLSVGVSLGADYQPSVTGGIKVATSGTSPSQFFIEAGYDKQFSFAAGQMLTDGATGITFQILPFQGWGSLLEQIARQAPVLALQELVPVLLDKLKKTGAADFAQRLSDAGTALQVSALVTAISQVNPFTAANVEQAALDWLMQRLSAENANATAQAVATLLQSVLPTQISTSGGLVTYKPSSSLPLTLLVGMDSSGAQPLAGVWAELELPELSLLKADIKRTGIGVPLSGAPNPVFSFGVDLTVPIEVTIGPRLSLGLDPAAGVMLSFDPLGDSSNPSQPSDLSREWLPTFFPPGPNDSSPTKDRVKAWIVDVLKYVLPRYVSAVVLNEAKVHDWLEQPILATGGAPTPGEILVASMLLRKSDQSYYLTDFKALQNLSIEAFLGNFLRTLLKTEIKVLSFGANNEGGVVIGPNPNDTNSFGLLISAPDFAVPKVQNVVLQLGATNTEWIANSDGDIGNLKPGISVYVPIKDSGGLDLKPDFSNLQLNLVNVGLDFKGSNGQPLVKMTRFQLGAVEPRGLVQLQMTDGSPSVQFGVDVTLQDVGISLAPNTLTPGGDPQTSNPIAKNLLGSGDSSSPQQENPTANPTFSVEAAYSKDLWVELRSQTSDGSQVIIPVERSFGPLYAKSIGIGWQPTKVLQLLFAGSIALAGLRADVVELTVGIPVTQITDFSKYTLDLQGLNVTFQGGSVDISGGFLKTTDPYLSYTGAAIIKAASFTIAAIGSYAQYPLTSDKDSPTVPSLFIFGALNAPLGGPPAFFITGIAAGFSYNRNILLPDVGDVQNFPLVSGVINGTFTSGQDPNDALTAIVNVVKPEVGQYWLAAGLKFNSFQLIDAFALLFLKFGREWEIALLGIASAPLPKGLSPGSALAYIELGLKVSIKPTEGIVSIEAQLTPNSYIIAKDCKLTGGFAFYLWFKDITTADGEHISAGDFVLTLGGYHPSFRKPKHYPDVPRLGFSWLIDAGVGTVSISGGAYFALTPTAVMAGGYLHVLFSAGPLRAWLDAVANFLVEWKPFYYQVGISISVGVAFETKILGVSVTLKVELGADLELEGPPTHGQVHVSWYIISFTIPFGASETETSDNSLDWPAFAEGFLPPPEPKQNLPKMKAMSLAAEDDGLEQQIVKLRAESGLLKDNGDNWYIRPVPFTLRVDSAIPTTQLTVDNSETTLSGPDVGVRPTGSPSTLIAPLTVAVKDAGNNTVNLKERQITMVGSLNGAPAALWSKEALDRQYAPDPDKMLIPGALVGIALQATQYVRLGSIDAFPIENLKYDPGDPMLLPFAITPQYPPAPRYSDEQQKSALAILKSSIMTAVDSRNKILQALQASNINAPLNPDLSVMASSAELVLQAPPVLARVGIYQTGTITEGHFVSLAEPKLEMKAAEPPPGHRPELLGILRRYQIDDTPTPPSRPGMLSHSNTTSSRWIDSRHTVQRHVVRAMADVAAEEISTTISPGMLVMWRVDPNLNNELQSSGDLPIKMIAFDRYGELLAAPTVEQAKAPALPEQTAEVALYGLDPTSARDVIGWQLDTELVRLNNYYAVGEDCIVRTQNVRRLRRKGRYAARGYIRAQEWLGSNQVQTRGGELKPGWVETILPGGRPCFAVVVAAKKLSSEDLRVTAAQGDQPGNSSMKELAPVAQFKSGTSTVLVYRTPAAEDTTYLNIITEPRHSAISLLGVYTLDFEPEAVEEAWPRLSLQQSATDVEADRFDSTVAKLVSR